MFGTLFSIDCLNVNASSWQEAYEGWASLRANLNDA